MPKARPILNDPPLMMASFGSLWLAAPGSICSLSGGSFGGLALASLSKSPLHGCLFFDRSLAADGRASIARKAEMRKINRCAFGNVSRPVALSPQTTFSLASSRQSNPAEATVKGRLEAQSQAADPRQVPPHAVSL